jgi:hypothetical protein
VVFLNGSCGRSVERSKDRPKPFFDRAPPFRVREDAKFIITNRGEDSPCHICGVHTGAEQFGKPKMERVRRICGVVGP